MALLGATVLLTIASLDAGAQLRIDRESAIRVAVNDEVERYLRVLQVTGLAPRKPWSVRGLSPDEITGLLPADSAHPWRDRLGMAATGRGSSSLVIDLLSPELRGVYNSAFPYGYNDALVWAGRGATIAVHAGVAARYRGLSLVLEPAAYWSANARFPLMAIGDTGRLAFARTRGIDIPQRFGDGAVQRVDLGQSTLRLDAGPVAVGASTANQHWGPAIEHPLLLGNNAAGFAHLFAGSAKPLNVWIGRVHGRVVWGRLEQSDYTPLDGRRARRFMSGIVGTFMPRGVDGLEIGGARFFHTLWPEGGLTRGDFLRPLSAFTETGRARQTGGSGIEPDNQLASVFFRWVFAPSGLEAYGEFAREDRNFDWRDLVLEPDHIGGYMLGVQKAWRTAPHRITAFRGEVLNTRISHLQLSRGQSPFYTHGSAAQGHTHRGQVLGSVGAYGGGAAVLAVDRWTPAGRWTATWSRVMQGEYLQPGGLPDPARADVWHLMGFEIVRLRRGIDLSAGLTGIYEYNRGFADDAFNLNLALGARAHW